MQHERYDFYLMRKREELYDWSEDPGSNYKLANIAEEREILISARKGPIEWVIANKDSLTEEYSDFANSQE